MRTRFDYVLRTIFLLCIFNFAVFWIVAVLIGGDAVNGYQQRGHYFLKSHGTVTEVSQAVFEYSKWHARSLFATHPLAFLCVALMLLRARMSNT
jgi:hypothetical protein